MNPYTQHPEQHPPAAPAPAPKRRRRWIAPALTGAAAFFAGSIVGVTGASTDTGDAPEPEVITETETVVETETVTEYIVPDSCLMAIDEAREGFTIAAEVMAVIQPAVEAAFYRDTAGMEAATADLEGLAGDLNRLDFINQSTACEEAAR